MSVYKGNAVLSPTAKAPVMSVRWTRANGLSERVRHEGSFNFLRYQILPQLAPFYDSIEINHDHGDWYVLEAATVGDEIIERYEIAGSNLSQSVLVNPTFRKRFLAKGYQESLYAKIVSDIATEVDKKKRGDQTYQGMKDAIDTFFDDVLGDDFADAMLKTGDQFLQAQYVFSHSLSMAARVYEFGGNPYPNMFEKTDWIFTLAQMRNAESVPGNFTIPNVAEWLKQAVSSSRIEGQRWELSVAYLGADKWERAYYEALSQPAPK